MYCIKDFGPECMWPACYKCLQIFDMCSEWGFTSYEGGRLVKTAEFWFLPFFTICGLFFTPYEQTRAGSSGGDAPNGGGDCLDEGEGSGYVCVCVCACGDGACK